MTHLTIKGVAKAFGALPVLSGLDLDVPAGSLTAILGPSGSGKTTLLRILAGFERADAGTVAIGDLRVDGPGSYLPPERRKIGYVPQEGSLFPHLTVAANVGFGLHRSARRQAHGTVDALLDSVGLAGMGSRYPHELSGGQQQRVALARALAIQPSLVLLDEPFAALDAGLRASIRAEVQQLFRAKGTTAVLVTHDQDEALAIADRVAVLRDGRIAQCSAPAELYSCPADAGIAAFIGDANLLDGIREASQVQTVLGSLPLAAGPDGCAPAEGAQVTVLIRPEHIDVHPAAQAAAGQITGRVIECDYYGHDAVLKVTLDASPATATAAAGTGLKPIIVRTTGNHQLGLGSQVALRPRGPVLTWPRQH